MLKEKIAEDIIEPVTTDEWRASEVGECEAFLCHLRLGHPALPFTGRVRHMLDDGLMHERDVVDRIRSKGFKVLYSYSEGQTSVSCYDKDGIVISGHPDGVLDIKPGGFELDYVDEAFHSDKRFFGLEVTAPSHFTFLRLERNHMRSEMWRKFVQIQMYLNSAEFRDEGIDGMITVVKNKNTSALYEEGIGFDGQVVTETIEKLKRVGDFVSQGKVSTHRCTDWRRHYCRYRDLCFVSDAPESVPTTGEILEGESLSEAEQLLEAERLWVKGKSLEVDAKELIEETRALFGDTIAEYGVKGLIVGQVKAVIIVPVTPHQSISFDILKQKYPTVYDALVTAEVPNPYLRVSRR